MLRKNITSSMENLPLEKLKSDITKNPNRAHSKLTDKFYIYEIIAENRFICKTSQSNIFSLWTEGNIKCSTINLMLIGETGKGKTTLVNAMFNHLMGINWKNEFRYTVPVYNSRNNNKCEVDSQTEKITLYNIPHVEGMLYRNDFVIIDTPGILDTRGHNVQKQNFRRIDRFLKTYITNEPIFIGLVVEANLENIDNIKPYMNDIRKKISNVTFILIATFANVFEPKCYCAFEKLNIRFDKKIKINNGVIFEYSDLQKRWEAWERQVTELMDYLTKKSLMEEIEDNAEVTKSSFITRNASLLSINSLSIISSDASSITNPSFHDAVENQSIHSNRPIENDQNESSSIYAPTVIYSARDPDEGNPVARAVAVYNSQAPDSEELSIKRGDELLIYGNLEKERWFASNKRTGEKGFVSSDYCIRLNENSSGFKTDIYIATDIDVTTEGSQDNKIDHTGNTESPQRNLQSDGVYENINNVEYETRKQLQDDFGFYENDYIFEDMNRERVEKIFASSGDMPGCSLERDSDNNLVLVLRIIEKEKVNPYKIKKDDAEKYYIHEDKIFSSVQELIKHYKEEEVLIYGIDGIAISYKKNGESMLDHNAMHDLSLQNEDSLTATDMTESSGDRDPCELVIKGSQGEKCIVCREIVYAMERLEGVDKVLHKRCFKCTECKFTLTLSNFFVSDGSYYCTIHYKKMRTEKRKK